MPGIPDNVQFYRGLIASGKNMSNQGLSSWANVEAAVIILSAVKIIVLWGSQKTLGCAKNEKVDSGAQVKLSFINEEEIKKNGWNNKQRDTVS